MKTLVFVSLGGGQGKSTSSYIVSKMLARDGFRVLAIDGNPQADLSLYLGSDTEPDEPTLLELLKNQVKPLDAIYPTSQKNLFIIPEDYKDFCLSQATLRFEQGIAQRLLSLCINQNGSGKISREALIEAMFLDLEAAPERLERVLEIAKERTALRKRAANWRRGQTMTRNAEKGNG